MLIDLAKIADVSLIMIDATVGLEIETFEYISMLKNHGSTCILGVLTHMDDLKQGKSLTKIKKQLKKRFQKDASDKAKLFYLYGLKHNLYVKLQMHNLARYLRVIKTVTSPFKQKYPYVVADRFEVRFDRNDSDKALASFFGYVRGNNFDIRTTIHFNGLGDFPISFVEPTDDPCPLEKIQKKGRRIKRLTKESRNIYAPYTNLNNIEFDKEAGYVNIPDRFVTFTKQLGEQDALVAGNKGVQMVRELQDYEMDEEESDVELIEGVTTVKKQRVEVEEKPDFAGTHYNLAEIDLGDNLENDVYGMQTEYSIN